jgi:hypothetical protein
MTAVTILDGIQNQTAITRATMDAAMAKSHAASPRAPVSSGDGWDAARLGTPCAAFVVIEGRERVRCWRPPEPSGRGLFGARCRRRRIDAPQGWRNLRRQSAAE